MAAKNQRVEVARAFRVRGEDIGVGSVIDLDLPTARELRLGKKVVFSASDAKLVTLPLQKKERPVSHGNQQIEALAAQVAVLTSLVEKLAGYSAKKEKASA